MSHDPGTPSAGAGWPSPYPPAAAWAPPAAPVPRPAFPHPVPREYHQILRTWNYAWWKPVVGLALFLAGVLASTAVVTVLLAGLATLWEQRSFAQIVDALANLGESSEVGPTELLLLDLTLAVMIPVAWLVVRVVHQLRPRWLASVAPRLRWGFLGVCMLLAAVALVAQLVVSAFLPDSGNPDISGHLNHFSATTAWLTLVVLLTTPLQAAGEEYAFRGYLLQAVGSFVDRWWWRWVAILTTASLFALAHGLQNPPLFFDRFMFGLVAGWLVIRTGGLEAGIAMHVLNNFLAFGLALAYGDLSDSLTVSEVSWWNIVATLTQSLLYAGLVVWAAKRLQLDNRTRPPVTEPALAGAGGA